MKIKIPVNYEKILFWCTYIPFCLIMLQLVLYKLAEVYSLSLASIHNLAMLFSALAMFSSAIIWVKFRKGLIRSVKVYALILFILGIEILFYPQNRSTIYEYLFNILFVSIPLIVNYSILSNDKIEVKILSSVSSIIFTLGSIYFFINIIFSLHSEYSMSYGYYMLIPACFFSYLFFKCNNIKYLLMSIMAVLMTMLLGSRGPVIIWAISFLVFLFYSKEDNKRKVIFPFILIAIAFFKEYIINSLSQVFLQLGISSRTLMMINSGSLISHDSGRNAIQDRCIRMICDYPFTGNGIGADVGAVYPHNFILEVLLHYGVVVGFILLLFLIWLSVKKYICCTDKMLFVFYLSVGFVPLLVSGTYLNSMPFAVFIGYLFRYNKCVMVKE